ncbi:Carbamoyl-phosphate synthase [Basidiobolus ranarum]|uniref:carbamoyl-phosphate synthase (ammonia) n=1 Tax=Basidiobolus ranarum TaxID=34480 RepID=A0ABR2VL11_9FUNG
MDAVALDGKLIMHVVSEHVENAGVHSGDATLVLPPQDLDPETVRKIVIATEKIGNALNVTGPYNIQFIAKNNEIKVIECNLRAARSFPFVSKVTGVDLIELATKAMLGVPVQAYPPTDIPENCVGVKVPQFSFSRLSGADPILGVEMASTGEVACFGKDKTEAYLKALLATGFQLPEKNILLSIGSFKEKQEFLPSAQKLHAMGYNLFATAGTADFMQEHGIPIKYLEVLGNDDDQKGEYSLNQHLSHNLIDLYVNLPSNNRYRRPASYVSRGYRTRRMAVDFAIPLITNIKCAKLFVDALTHKHKLSINKVDYKTSHRSVTLPGLVNIQTFIPGLVDDKSTDFDAVTKAAVAGGFTSVCVMPMGAKSALKDIQSLVAAKDNAHLKAHCDYSISVAATADNAGKLAQVFVDANTLFVSFDKRYDGYTEKLANVASYFESCPRDVVLVTDAKDTALASILLLASLQGRSVHVTNISTKQDITLISLSKERGLKVTCDVAVFNLFLTEDKGGLPERDVKALWEHLDVIDCFSVGNVPVSSYAATVFGESSSYLQLA